MDANQVEKYEYCKDYIERIEQFKTNIKHKSQLYGCGSQRPNIEHDLEKIHREMHESVIEAYEVANNKINEIIKSI